MKTGVDGTKCRIAGCGNKVWPNKKIGFCSNHYQKLKNGTIDINGNKLKRHKECGNCGNIFELKTTDGNVRFCETCRPSQRKQTCAENYVGEYRRKKETHKTPIIYSADRYVISKRDMTSRYPRNADIINFRQSGMTLAEIGKRFNISRERVRQILKATHCDD